MSSSSARATKVLHNVEDTVQAGVGAAFEWLEPRVELATERIAEGMSKAQPVLQEKLDKMSPMIEDAQKRAGETRQKFVDEYVPAASSKLSNVAANTAARLHDADVPVFVEDAVTRMTGDKKAVKKARKAAEDAMKVAAKELKKNQPKQKKSKKGLLIFAVVVAATTAGIAIWRASRPIEDPWKTPAPMSPANNAASFSAEADAPDEGEGDLPTPKPSV